MSYIKAGNNEELKKAIVRLLPSIDISQIFKFIDNINCISDIRKDFYKKIIEIRYNIIKNNN